MVTVPGRRATNNARPRSIGTSRARFESLTVQWSTVESARSATNNTYSPMRAVSSAGRMPNAAGAGAGGGGAGEGTGGGAGGGVCTTFGALESLQARATAAGDAAATSNAAIGLPFTGQRVTPA